MVCFLFLFAKQKYTHSYNLGLESGVSQLYFPCHMKLYLSTYYTYQLCFCYIANPNSHACVCQEEPVTVYNTFYMYALRNYNLLKAGNPDTTELTRISLTSTSDISWAQVFDFLSHFGALGALGALGAVGALGVLSMIYSFGSFTFRLMSCREPLCILWSNSIL